MGILNNLHKELHDVRRKHRKTEDELLHSIKKVLHEEQFNERNILDNLKAYNRSFELLNEENIDLINLFTEEEIKKVCVKFGLRFVNSKFFKGEIPYEAILKIKHLNSEQGKNLKHFKVVSLQKGLKNSGIQKERLLFCETTGGHYYLIHRWGTGFHPFRKIMLLPFRSFESWVISLMILVFILTMLTPTKQITTDIHAVYYSKYRVAWYFHLLILLSGLSTFLLFAFHVKFFQSNWESEKT